MWLSKGNMRDPLVMELFCTLTVSMSISWLRCCTTVFVLFCFGFGLCFLAAVGLRYCVRAFSSCSERGLLFVVVCGLLIAVASLVVEHSL